jgi:hypothetical protein
MDELVNWLALALLVTGIGADHTNDAFAFDDFAVFAKLFNRCANFHIISK